MDAGTVFLILVVVVVIALVVRSRSKEDTSAIALSSPPTDTIDAATSFMVSQGYTLTFKGDTSATFARPQRPSDTLGCLFLLLGIIPGLLYYGLFKGTLTTTLIATSGPAGTQLAISGDDAQARASLYRWAQQEAAEEPEAAAVVEAVAELEAQRKYCWKCGAQIRPTDTYCSSCRAWVRTQS